MRVTNSTKLVSDADREKSISNYYYFLSFKGNFVISYFLDMVVLVVH